MADNNTMKFLLLGGAGVAAWWFFFRTPTPTTPAPAAPGAPSPAPAQASGTAVNSGANSLDAIHNQLVKFAQAPSEGLGADAWGYFLNQILASLGKGAAPDPVPLFAATIPGYDRSQLLTIDQYWAVMAPALKTQLGLSGLGIFGGLAGLAWGRY